MRWLQWRCAVRGQVLACSWALLAAMAGCAKPRQRRVDGNFVLTSQSGVSLSTVRRCGETERGDDSFLPPSRQLSSDILLHGNVLVLANWTCKDKCTPLHKKEVDLPGIELENKCTESRQVGSLKLQDELDLKCLGSNLTCDDIENNETWKNWKEDTFSTCNQDEELLHGECILVCRFGIHPTKRCTYWFDKNNKYGMHGSSGVYGFHHCVQLRVCDKNKPNTTTEENWLYCNITDMHALLSSTAGPTTTTFATTAMPTTQTTPAALIVYRERESVDNGAVVLGIVLGGCAVGSMALLSAAIYFLVCRTQKPARELPVNPPATGVLHEPEDGEGNTVVVGRPVAGVAPPAGESARSDEKGEKD